MVQQIKATDILEWIKEARQQATQQTTVYAATRLLFYPDAPPDAPKIVVLTLFNTFSIVSSS
jgi:hypothetical protein